MHLCHPTLIPPWLESSSKEVRLGTPRRVRRDFIGGADFAPALFETGAGYESLRGLHGRWNRE
jgi:hypothetical protein